MFLPVNIRKKNCRSYFNFYCKWYIWKQPSKVVSFKRSFVQVCLRNSHEGIISGKAAGCMSAVLVEMDSFAGGFQVFCLLLLLPLFQVNGYFGVTNPGGCLIILNTLFILILQGRKLFQRAPFAVGILINNWYYVSCLLNITSALELWRGFLHR